MKEHWKGKNEEKATRPTRFKPKTSRSTKRPFNHCSTSATQFYGTHIRWRYLNCEGATDDSKRKTRFEGLVLFLEFFILEKKLIPSKIFFAIKY